MIDWDLAVRIGTRLGGDGPAVSPAQAREAVAELRADADRSTPLVAEFTGLVAAERTAPLLVVDRAGWVQANADAFAGVLEPLVSSLTRKGAPGPVAHAIGSRVTGAEVGTVLGFLSTKVLGQFDPFHDSGAGQGGGQHGRLLLVAPNIVHVENELGVDPADFRLWVGLHEETHRVQFTAVPWMRDHLLSEVENLVGSVDLDPAALLDQTMRRVSEAVRGDGEGGGSLVDLFASPEQRVVLDRVTGMMSLLEGHADVVMDGVGPEVIGSVAQIRAKFDQRRKGAGALDRLVRRLLGLDQKMAQYRDGAAFVRGVVDRVGMDGFNEVWAKPDHLPAKDELARPEAWVARVLG